MFFNFWALLLKMYIFEVVTFFSRLAVVHIYNIHVFDEVFFPLTVRMPMVTNLFRVVIYCEEISPINMDGIYWSGFVGSCGK